MVFKNKVLQYVYNLFLALDQLINCVVLLGDPDDSVSGRCGFAIYVKRTPKWWVTPLKELIDLFFLVVFSENDHCKNAIEAEEKLQKELWRWYK